MKGSLAALMNPLNVVKPCTGLMHMPAVVGVTGNSSEASWNLPLTCLEGHWPCEGLAAPWSNLPAEQTVRLAGQQT